MVINHWSRQDIVPCETVARWSRNVKESYGPALKKYIMVSFEKFLNYCHSIILKLVFYGIYKRIIL